MNFNANVKELPSQEVGPLPPVTPTIHLGVRNSTYWSEGMMHPKLGHPASLWKVWAPVKAENSVAATAAIAPILESMMMSTIAQSQKQCELPCAEEKPRLLKDSPLLHDVLRLVSCSMPTCRSNFPISMFVSSSQKHVQRWSRVDWLKRRSTPRNHRCRPPG